MREIYLDNCATTRVADCAAAAALDVMQNEYGNPSSLHKKGFAAERRLAAAREQVARGLGCSPEELVFTSGGTEANNLALFGGAAAKKRIGKSLVATAWEHSSVLAPLRELEKEGYDLKLINPDSDGRVDIGAIAAAVDSGTILVSCMLVNSELGSIADIAELSKKVKRVNPNTLIHCDAVQAFGKLDISVKKLGVDLLSVSGHKIHAPKGVGGLYIKKGVRIVPRVFGGGQEKNLRSGTESLPLIAAFGAAAELAQANFSENMAHLQNLYEYFVNKLTLIDGICINSPVGAAPYICNISVRRIKSEVMLHYLAAKGIFVSSGSACSKGKPSHMLAAMGLPPARADSAIRVSFSRYTAKDEIDEFINALLHGLEEIKA